MVHWGGLCCLGAAACYLLSRRTGRFVAFLNSVKRVDHLSDLESTVLPSIIAVSGRVGSETPIKCEHSDILGVIVQETTEQQFLKRNWKFSWVQDNALLPPTTKEVPWYLDDGTGLRVNVAEAQSAIGFALTVGSEVFENPEPSSLVRATLDYLRGLKMIGIRHIERVLPIGTRLTVVGQAIKDGIGDVIRIQKPEQGPFYISPIPLDELISKLGKWSRRFKNASIGLAFLGVFLISRRSVIKDILVRTGDIIKHILVRTGDVIKHIIVRTGDIIKHILVRIGDILERRRLRLLRKRVDDAAAKRKEQATEEDGNAPDLCICCFEQKCDSVFPCGHMCCCITCSLKLQGSRKPCPLCRKPVDPVLKIYRTGLSAKTN